MKSFLLAVLAVTVISQSGCNSVSRADLLCYSRFSDVGEPVFSSPNSDPLFGLMRKFNDAYSNNDGVVDIPIASGPNIYLASKCSYLSAILPTLEDQLTFNKISQQEFEAHRALAGQDGLLIGADPKP